MNCMADRAEAARVPVTAAGCTVMKTSRLVYSHNTEALSLYANSGETPANSLKRNKSELGL